ncbi:MAG TPA: thioredoxin family protein [Pedobacter sp.]|nr:thioredoxin family protein [Pedobacter sp.]
MNKLLIIALLALSVPAFAQNKETVKIYNPQADAHADIDAAVAKAKKAGKHVFIQIGGNWCTWCVAFHRMVDNTSELKQLLNDNYETVLVNYSPENKNEPVLASLGYPQRFGFPVFLILDGNGKLLHTQNSAYLETPDVDEKTGKKKTGHDVKVVSNFLQGWTAKALDPSSYKSAKTK